MSEFLMLLLTFVVMLCVTSSAYLLSIVDVMAFENIKSTNISYTRHVLEFPSEISWLTSNSYDRKMSKDNIINSSQNRPSLLAIQTHEGNIHILDVAALAPPSFLQSMADSNISTFKVNASVNTGGPVIIDLNKDGNYEIISTTTNGSLTVIDHDRNGIIWYNNTKLSSRTQIVPYLNNLTENILLAVSENGTLLMIKSTIKNSENDSSSTSKFVFEYIKTNFTNLLTDGRIVVDNIDSNDNNSTNEVLILADPVDSYPHGSLGDIFEPSKLLVLEQCHNKHSKTSNLCQKEILKPPKGMEIFETIMPVIIEIPNGSIRDNKITSNDINNNGPANNFSKGIALVASDISVGSAAYVYDGTSSILFSSKPIGQGFRWLLILGSTMMDSNQSMLVINETPHLSGIVKFIDMINNKTMEIEGFSAHDYGSRNIGMYAITDANKDGHDDLIIPTLDKKEIAILSVSDKNDNILVNENLKLDEKLSSNIITIDINYDGYADIIAGDRLGHLYIFKSLVR